MNNKSFTLWFFFVTLFCYSSCSKSKLPTLDKLLKIKPEKIPSQFFKISSNHPISICGKEGTILSFQKNTFDYDDSLPVLKDTIIIELKELYDNTDFIKTSIMTFSDKKKPLLLNNAIFISAWRGDKKVNILKEKKIYISYPVRRKAIKLNNFEGKINSESVLFWKQSIDYPLQDTSIHPTSAENKPYIWSWDGPFVNSMDYLDNEGVVSSPNSHIATSAFYERLCYFKNNNLYRTDSVTYRCFRILFETFYRYGYSTYSLPEIDEYAISRMRKNSEKVAKKYYEFARKLTQKYNKVDIKYRDIQYRLTENNFTQGFDFKQITALKKNIYYREQITESLGWKAVGISLVSDYRHPFHLPVSNKYDSVKFCILTFMDRKSGLLSHQIQEEMNGNFYFFVQENTLMDLSLMGFTNSTIIHSNFMNRSVSEIDLSTLKIFHHN